MEGADFLLAGVLFLFAAVVAVPIAARLGIGAVLGYLLAGIAIGPWGLGFISDVAEILHFSELGVVWHDYSPGRRHCHYFRLPCSRPAT